MKIGQKQKYATYISPLKRYNLKRSENAGDYSHGKGRNFMQKEQQSNGKVGIVGYLMLIIFLLVFSGLLQGIPYLGTFDITNLIGSFGTIAGDEGDFTGSGGTGAEQGFMLCLSLLPTLMLSMGLVEIAQHYGALEAAGKLLTPVMRFIMGVPGCMAISLVGSLNSSDVGSITTRELYEEGLVTDDERVRMIAFQFPSCGMISNLVLLIGMGGSAIMLSMSAYMLILLLLKVGAANIMRLVMRTRLYKKPDKGEGN